jgi:alpha-glucosidase (family GH31 glycosyl hydrolase)
LYSQNENREYVGYHQNVGEIIIQVSDGEYVVTPFTKKAFHILFVPKNSKLKYSPIAINTETESVDFKIVDKTDIVKIESNTLKVVITKSPFNISFFNHEKLLFSEKIDAEDIKDLSIVKFTIDDNEVFYGGGIRCLGMNRRGNVLDFYNKGNYTNNSISQFTNYTLPVFISSKKYAVVFDNNLPEYIDLDSKKNNTIEYKAKTELINYYVITGNDWFDLSSQYAIITGHQPLLQIKTLCGLDTNMQVYDITKTDTFGIEFVKAVYDKKISIQPNESPIVLLNAAFTGAQKYSLIPYFVDTTDSWKEIKQQTIMLQQMGMQGLPYTHYKFKNIQDTELQNRINQNSVFQPVYYIQDDTANNNLRHRLLPYIYSMAFENNQNGYPMTYPIFYIEPKNNKVLVSDKSYMWGESFLVSPIMDKDIDSTKIYLPKGNSWTDFYTSKVYSGGKTVNVKVDKSHIPVFVKGGTFMPTIPNSTTIEDYNIISFNMHFYADSKVLSSGYDLYNDDGKTFNNYKNGKFEIIHFYARNTERILYINIKRETGKRNNKIIENQITFVIHNIYEKPKRVLVNGEKSLDKPIFNETAKTVTFSTNLRTYLKKVEIYY